jgi:hypothetical protein
MQVWPRSNPSLSLHDSARRRLRPLIPHPDHGYAATREAAAFARVCTPQARSYVRYRGQPGNYLLVLSFTGFDPSETWAGQDFRSAKALFVPSLKRDIVPSIA